MDLDPGVAGQRKQGWTSWDTVAIDAAADVAVAAAILMEANHDFIIPVSIFVAMASFL